MNITVCIKQVPSSNEVRLDPEKHTIIRDGRQSVINPFDTHGIEAAVRIKEQLGGRISCLSMGIPATERLLRDAIAMGADDALLLTDRAFAGADTWSTAYALACGIRKMGGVRTDKNAAGVDLIVCGKMAVDGDTAQIGPELATQLGIPFVHDVFEICEAAEDHLVVRYLTDEGSALARVGLPALITVTRELNQPRFPSIAGIRASQTAPFVSCGYEEVGAELPLLGLKGSPTRVVRSFTPIREHQTVAIEGDSSEVAAKLFSMVKEVR